MVAKGRKPKPAHLRLVDGTHRRSRHGSEADRRAEIAHANMSFGPLVRPKGLKGAALQAWKTWIEPAFWLDGSSGIPARALCELYAEFVDRPTDFPAAKHSQMRAYMSALGITDETQRAAAREKAKPRNKFFDD
jgi:hypothetical protein